MPLVGETGVGENGVGEHVLILHSYIVHVHVNVQYVYTPIQMYMSEIS